ncbi:hypothetical protein EXIGLDRAFT_758826 [Exidia glandulosa HHB12029]|uniref:Uncharacterized protein n=1 Tax=Exidia glandulosa HHB12029 TaxID=1314781 RepID=A0A165QE40_EXIGL|nr:hypothetical protein EXIGLDRAFT_758826 [Exidia glandulosa HHB12029]
MSNLTAILIFGTMAVIAVAVAIAAMVITLRECLVRRRAQRSATAAQERATAAQISVYSWARQAYAVELARTQTDNTDTSCPTPPPTPTMDALPSSLLTPGPLCSLQPARQGRPLIALDHFSRPIHVTLADSPRASVNIDDPAA